MKRIGIIGVGGIANGVHITQLLKLNDCKITAICDINEFALEKTAERVGLSSDRCFYDYRELIDCDDVDAIEICTPNHVHVEIAEYAVKKGKPFNCEKPLGIELDECLRLQEAVNRTNITNMMSFSYRFMPAVRYAKWIIDNGMIGSLVSLNVEYSKSSAFLEGRRLDWRFVKKYAGTGVLGDLGVHLIDMAQLLAGDFVSVCGMYDTVVKQRLKLDRDELANVETDDYCNFIAKLKSNDDGHSIAASFAITRCAIGHTNTIRYDIYGDKGTISFDLNNPEVLGVCIGDVDKKSNALHNVNVPNEFFITQAQAYVNALHGNKCPYFPTINDGVKCQRVLDAISRSAEAGRFVEIL